MKRIVVMGGRGHVGSAIASIMNLYHKVFICDIGLTPKEENIDVLHVAIPYSNNFIQDVTKLKKLYSPKLIIVHSTVPVGTTKKVDAQAVHAPVRGQHSDLRGGILLFEMPVSGGKASEVARYLKAANIKCSVWKKTEETELAKLLCLSRYLNDLAFYEVSQKICKSMKIDESILLKWTKSYNDGYKHTNHVRPDLKFPNGKVGGTCVIPVSKMLYKQTKNEYLGKNLRVFNEN